MRILIDTHVWIWWLTTPRRLNPSATELLTDRGNAICLSTASIWEIAIKYSLGKLTLPAAPASLVPQAMAEDGMTGLAIEQAHALRVARLPFHHRDPFDRLLIAQAQVERLPIMTADRAFAAYDVDLINAS